MRIIVLYLLSLICLLSCKSNQQHESILLCKSIFTLDKILKITDSTSAITIQEIYNGYDKEFPIDEKPYMDSLSNKYLFKKIDAAVKSAIAGCVNSKIQWIHSDNQIHKKEIGFIAFSYPIVRGNLAFVKINYSVKRSLIGSYLLNFKLIQGKWHLEDYKLSGYS